MSDPFDLVRDIAPTVEDRPELIERVRNDLMSTIDESPERHDRSPAVNPGRQHTRRRWLIPAAAALVLASAATAWAATRTSADSTTLECPGNAVINAVTGDPVVDCSNEWRRSRNTEPPAMVAFDNGRGGVIVRLATDDVVGGSTPLEPGKYQNAALIELRASLDDVGEGLTSDCYDEPAARELALGELSRLGLTGWTITADDTRRPDGESLCALFIVEPSMQQVELIGIERTMPGSNPYEPFAAALADQLETTCLSLAEAGVLARSLAAEAEIVIDGTTIELTEEAGVLVINEVDDPAADCTRSVVNVGGLVEVTLRGPTD